MFVKKATIFFLIIGLISCGATKGYDSSNIKREVSTSKAYYKESSGLTIEDAVIIYASGSMEGIPLEYKFVEKKEGRRGVDWNLVQQSVMNNEGKSYDVLHIKLTKNEEEKTYYFDITNFFGKF